jgi:predicted transcriptional regulator of viral defense system
MSNRSLSPLESKLILHLEWEKQPVVSIEDAMKIMGVSYDHARQLLHGLVRDRWLARIQSGKYELIPAERGEYAFPDTNPLFLGSMLVQPYYYSFATAAFFHGLSTQASQMVFIATSQDLSRRRLVREKEYRLVLLPEYKFFGWSEMDAYGSRVNMAEPEKAVLDSLDHPLYAGDIPELATMLWRGRNRLEWQKMVEYAMRFRSRALLQRLGYLLEAIEIPIEPQIRKFLLEKTITNGKCYLGQPGRWGTGGEYSSTWRVVDNIPRKELIAELQVK